MMSRREIATSFVFGFVAFSALFVTTGCESIKKLFGPPAVELGEQYAGSGSADYDHALFDAILKRHVDAEGFVDYEALHKDPGELDAYIQALSEADFAALTRDAKLALLINAYNAWTLRLILDHWPLKSIKDIPSAQRWDAEKWTVAGKTLSLNSLEHEWLRKRFREPRMHFAINCASIGCPPLRNEAYRSADIDRQLDEQCRIVHKDGSRWLRFDSDGSLSLTKIYSWFGGDFVQVAGSVSAFVARYNDRVKRRIGENGNDVGRDIANDWLDYDWGINIPR